MSAETQTALGLTARGARKIAEILAAEAPGMALRVSVSGGGCSGFQYGFSFDDAPAGDDLLIEKDGARVLIDAISAGFLKGSEIDYVDEMIGATLQIRNPNAKSSCGCGASFSV